MARSSRHQRATAQNTYRFFVEPDAIRGAVVALESAELAHQLSTVLRLETGDTITLLDDSGARYLVALEHVSRTRVTGTVVERSLAGGEPRVRITVYAAVMRPDHFEWVLQKCTELGVTAFVPVMCARSGPNVAAERKTERWERIVREAAEQSCRGRLPRIETPVPFADACARAAAEGPAFLLWEGGTTAGLRPCLRHLIAAGVPTTIGLLSGPEGGLTQEEYLKAQACGMMPVSLGPRILRAETAPTVAAAAILYELGELE